MTQIAIDLPESVVRRILALEQAEQAARQQKLQCLQTAIEMAGHAVDGVVEFRLEGTRLTLVYAEQSANGQAVAEVRRDRESD